MSEHVVLVVGAPGAGKTTAISTLADAEPARSETPGADATGAPEALDYGQIVLGPNERVRIYGVPSRQHFDFMWQILEARAVGLLVLVSNDAADPKADLLASFAEFQEIHDRGGVVVGVTHADLRPFPSTVEYQELLAARYPATIAPVFTVDARSREQLVTLLSVLAANVDSRARLAQA